MKVIKDGKGKNIIDFEGLEIDLSDVEGKSCGVGGVQSLFNDDVVSEVRNGVWLFDKKQKIG